MINEQTFRALQSFEYQTRLISNSINSLIYFSLVFFVAWRFGLMTIGFSVVLLMLFPRLNNIVRNLSRKTVSETSQLANLLIQCLQAFKYLTATEQKNKFTNRVMNSINKLTKYQMQAGIAISFTQAIREPLVVILIMMIVLFQLIYLEQPLTPILVSIILFYRGFNSVLSGQHEFQNMLQFIGSMEALNQEFILLGKHKEANGKKKIQRLSQDISFKNVHYNYDLSSNAVIKGIDIKIPVRKTVALVGASGAGKSTIIDLISLVLKPSQGEVLIDGVTSLDIELASWRNQIGFVSQETVIFDDTIANNISLSQSGPEKNLTLDACIKQAAQFANINDFIESLPDGYDTLVGDNGVRLSGGERQRLFIARELFRKPDLLILDEATSALDTKSELEIQKSIDNLRGQITVVIIAHRLSTIRNVDIVFVIDDGRVVEQGNYNELRNNKNSKLSELIKMQAL